VPAPCFLAKYRKCRMTVPTLAHFGVLSRRDRRMAREIAGLKQSFCH